MKLWSKEVLLLGGIYGILEAPSLTLNMNLLQTFYLLFLFVAQ